MPELYLFGAIFLGILMFIFWIVVTIATFINNAAEKAEAPSAPQASPKAKNQDWEYQGSTYNRGVLYVEDDAIDVFGAGSHELDSRVTFRLHNTSKQSLMVFDVLLDGTSLQPLVPHHPTQDNSEFMIFVLGILREAVRAGSLPEATYQKAEQTWAAIKIQDQLMRLEHIAYVSHDTHDEFIWKA